MRPLKKKSRILKTFLNLMCVRTSSWISLHTRITLIPTRFPSVGVILTRQFEVQSCAQSDTNRNAMQLVLTKAHIVCTLGLLSLQGNLTRTTFLTWEWRGPFSISPQQYIRFQRHASFPPYTTTSIFSQTTTHNKHNTTLVKYLENFSPVFPIGPYPSWSDPKKIASIDPFGHVVTEAYANYLDKGYDIR